MARYFGLIQSLTSELSRHRFIARFQGISRKSTDQPSMTEGRLVIRFRNAAWQLTLPGICLILAFLPTVAGVETGVSKLVLKIIGGSYPYEYLGEGDKSRLVPVDFKNALRIDIRHTKDASRQILKSSKHDSAITEPKDKRIFFVRWFSKWNPEYKIQGGIDESTQGLNLNYYSANDYVISHNGKCLGLKGKYFKNVSCNDLDKVAHFSICKNNYSCDIDSMLLEMKNSIDNLARMMRFQQQLLTGGSYNPFSDMEYDSYNKMFKNGYPVCSAFSDYFMDGGGSRHSRRRHSSC